MNQTLFLFVYKTDHTLLTLTNSYRGKANQLSGDVLLFEKVLTTTDIKPRFAFPSKYLKNLPPVEDEHDPVEFPIISRTSNST